MASILDSQVARIDGFFPMVPKPSGVAITVNAAAAANQNTMTASAATILTGMDVGIGTPGENYEVCRVTTGGVTGLVFSKNLKFDHPVGDPIVELAYLNLGDPESDGVKFTINGESTTLKNALSRLAQALRLGYVDLELAWRFGTLSIDSLWFAMGGDRAKLYGDGTAAAVGGGGTTGPRGFSTDGSEFGTAGAVSLKICVQMVNGAYATIEAYSLSFDPTGLASIFGRGEDNETPVKALAANAAIDYTNARFLPASTISANAPTYGDIWSHMSNLYLLSDTGTPTSLTAQVAAAASVLPLASTTGFTTPLTFCKTTANAKNEYHLINAVVASNANLRTQTRNILPSGATVTAQLLTPIAGLTNPFEMNISGSTRNVRGQQYRNTIAKIITDAEMAFKTSSAAFSQANTQQMLGIASALISQNVVPITGGTGTAQPTTVLFEGNLSNGKKLYICLWDAAARIGGELDFGVVPDTETPMEWVPKVMQAWVHA